MGPTQGRPTVEGVLGDIQAAKALAMDAKITSDRGAAERGYLEALLLTQHAQNLARVWCEGTEENYSHPKILSRVSEGLTIAARNQEDPNEALWYFQMSTPELDAVLFGESNSGGWFTSYALFYARRQAILALLTALAEQFEHHPLCPKFLARMSKPKCPCGSESLCGEPRVLCVRQRITFEPQLGLYELLHYMAEVLQSLRSDLESLPSRDGRLTGAAEQSGGGPVEHTWYSAMIRWARAEDEVERALSPLSEKSRALTLHQFQQAAERALVKWLTPFKPVVFRDSPKTHAAFNMWLDANAEAAAGQ